MEKTSSREAVASRLKQKEAEISRHLEALQGEMTSTGSDVKKYLKEKPLDWCRRFCPGRGRCGIDCW